MIFISFGSLLGRDRVCVVTCVTVVMVVQFQSKRRIEVEQLSAALINDAVTGPMQYINATFCAHVRFRLCGEIDKGYSI